LEGEKSTGNNNNNNKKPAGKKQTNKYKAMRTLKPVDPRTYYRKPPLIAELAEHHG